MATDDERSRYQDILDTWPEPSREAATFVVEAHGPPQQATDSELVWLDVAPWKRIVATRAFHEHHFPAPHIDCVESFIDYAVPLEVVSDVVAFDGSVMVDRTAGEVSARCHDEEANFLALNLMHDIVAGRRSVQDARQYYAKEFLDHRRKRPTPYMEGLRFSPPAGQSADPDHALLSDDDVQAAKREGTNAA